MARDALKTAGIATGETAAEIVNLAIADVGIQWTADGCTDFAWGVSNLAGIPFFDLENKTINNDPRFPQDTTYVVPHAPGTFAGSDATGDGWTTQSISGSVNINSVTTLKSILQPGDIVRVYAAGNTTESAQPINGKFLAHEFIVATNSGGDIQVVDNWSTSTFNTGDKIVEHSFTDISNAFAPNDYFYSAYVSRINSSYVSQNFDQSTLKGNGYGDFSTISTRNNKFSKDDFNNDGKADILWRADSGQTYLWDSTGGSSVGFTGQDLGVVSTDWRIQDTADFNNDGKADILWRNDNGHVYLWDSTGGSSVGFIGQDLGVVSTDWHIQDTADFNNDGKADILWRNDSGQTYLWDSTGGSSVGFSGQDLGVVSTDWHIAQGP